jgi:hypothetical protein
MDSIEIKSKLHDYIEVADDAFLKLVQVMFEQHFKESVVSKTQKAIRNYPSKPSKLAQAATTTRSKVSLAQLMQEQNYKPVSYATWQSIVAEVEWGESLGELLEAAK